MAKLGPNATEQATTVFTGSAGATGVSATVPLFGPFNLFVFGTFVGSIQLERSFDGGTTWVPVGLDQAGDYEKFTIPVSYTYTEVEHGMLYRLNATAYTSGTISYRISQSTDYIALARFQ